MDVCTSPRAHSTQGQMLTYVSGKSLLPMLHVLCNTNNVILQVIVAIIQQVIITNCDYRKARTT